MEEKNVYELNNDELMERFEEEFKKNYNKYDYDESSWDEILKLYENAKKSFIETNFKISLYHETFHKMSLIKKKERKENVFINSLVSFFSKVGNRVLTVYKATNFIFSIPALTFASIIFTLFIHLFLGIFLYAILPSFIDDFMVKSIMACIIFIILKLVILFGLVDSNLLFNYKSYIIKFLITIPFYALIFLIFMNIESHPVLEEFKVLFYPHMWLSIFTGEYVFSPMIALLINCLIPVIIFLFIQRKYEK